MPRDKGSPRHVQQQREVAVAVTSYADLDPNAGK